MSSSLQFFLALSILIACARIGGALSKRLGQAVVLGELLAGVVLGPSLLDFFHLSWFTDAHLAESVQQLAELGVVFLMFLAGLEIDLSEMVKTGRAAALAGGLGVAATVLLILGAALLFGLPPLTALFLGLALTATSIGISAQTLMELGVLRRRESLTLLGAAVIDDVLTLVILSMFLVLVGGSGGGWAGVGLVLLRLALYLAAVAVVGFWLLPRLTLQIERWSLTHGLTSFVLVVVLLFAWAAEWVGGVAAITGAFLVGLAFARSALRLEIEHNFSALVYGFLVPLFFVSIGLRADLRALSGSGLLFSAVLLFGVAASKILGGGLGARWGGLAPDEALRLGLGMVARGEVTLIVATLGLGDGLITQPLFVQIVLVVLVTTVLTPLLLRWAYSREARTMKDER